MTELYLIRHGETEWNRSGHHQGHKDSDLTESGVSQAEAMGKRLASEEITFDGIYTSDLGRASHTCGLIAQTIGQEDLVMEREGLRERALGPLEGLTYEEIENQLPDDFAAHTSGDPHYRPDGGESWADTFSRACAVVRQLCEDHPDQRIMIVSHGGVLGMVLRDALGLTLLPPRRFALPNAALNIFDYRDRQLELRCWGDTSHIKDVTILDEMMK